MCGLVEKMGWYCGAYYTQTNNCGEIWLDFGDIFSIICI
jgi:hypothetical protein